METIYVTRGGDGEHWNITEEDKKLFGQAAQAGQAIGGLFQKTALQKELKAVCGPKPIFGKKKKEARQKCVTSYLASKNKPASPAYTPPSSPAYTPPSSPVQTMGAGAGKKSKTGMWIGIGAGVLVVGGLVTFLILRKKK